MSTFIKTIYFEQNCLWWGHSFNAISVGWIPCWRPTFNPETWTPATVRWIRGADRNSVSSRTLIGQRFLLACGPRQRYYNVSCGHLSLIIRLHHAKTQTPAVNSFFCSGNNQRLEFLGDTVLQLIVSDHLFKHFPKHHEGHLSLLRSSLVSNKTQAYVCEELTMAAYQIKEQGISKSSPSVDIKMKDKADLVEGELLLRYSFVCPNESVKLPSIMSGCQPWFHRGRLVYWAKFEILSPIDAVDPLSSEDG